MKTAVGAIVLIFIFIFARDVVETEEQFYPVDFIQVDTIDFNYIEVMSTNDSIDMMQREIDTFQKKIEANNGYFYNQTNK